MSFVPPPHLSNLEEIEAALTNRIPKEFLSSFFTPFHPLEISAEDCDIVRDELNKAVLRIQTAIQNSESVLIYGDYDCDGVTSAALLWQVLRSLGLTAQPFLPRRDLYGYGMSVSALEDLVAKHGKFDLIITVDNGIVAHEAVDWAKQAGIDVIITDHHEPGNVLPDAVARVHSPLLCGAGVAWMLCRELSPDLALEHLDLVCIGTLADQVRLLGANRSLVIHGLNQLKTTRKVSLQALAQITATDLTKLTAQDVTFRFAPRINALGRLADPMDALRALVSQSPARITELLQIMEKTNAERQALTKEYYVEILDRVMREVRENTLPKVIVIAGDFHEGIIGLLASALVEQFHTPAIVISTQGEVWKSSGRSTNGFHLTEALRAVSGVSFISLGGHAKAGGFSLSPKTGSEDIKVIQSILSEKFEQMGQNHDTEYTGTVVAQLLNSDLLHLMSRFEPFGSGNSEPILFLSDVQFTHIKEIGKDRKHWKGIIRDPKTFFEVPAIFFKAADKYQSTSDTIAHLAVKVVPSTYRSQGFDVHIVEAWDTSLLAASE